LSSATARKPGAAVVPVAAVPGGAAAVPPPQAEVANASAATLPASLYRMTPHL
jgi:hypothetical protein